MKNKGRVGAALLVVGVLAFFLGTTGTSEADECKPWEFFCKAAKVALTDAMKEGGVIVREASSTLHSTVNFWQWIIQKYHTGTPEEQAQARELIKKVFGADSIEDTQPFEMSFSFEGIDLSDRKLDVIVLRDYNKPDPAAKIAQGNTIDFNAKAVIGSHPAVSDDYEQYVNDVETVRARLDDALAKAYTASLNWTGDIRELSSTNRVVICTSLRSDATHGRGGQAGASCVDRPKWVNARKSLEALRDAIMLTVDPKVDKRANRPSVTFPYEGYNYLTAVIPEEHLEAQPNLVMHLRIHRKGHPDQSVPLFEGNEWSVSQGSILAQNPVYTTDKRKEHSGRYVAYTINMGLDADLSSLTTRTAN